MMWVKIPTPFFTFLTGVIITLKYLFSPFFILFRATKKFVLMASPTLFIKGYFSFFLNFSNFFWRGFVRTPRTLRRTNTSYPALNFVFRHKVPAYRTGYFNAHTIIANSSDVCSEICLKSLATCFAGFADTSCGSISTRCAGNAIVARSLSRASDGGYYKPTIRAWFRKRIIAIPTHSIICFFATDFAMPEMFFHGMEYTTSRPSFEGRLFNLQRLGLAPRRVD